MFFYITISNNIHNCLDIFRALHNIMTCNKHNIYTIMHVLGKWHVKLCCQRGNSGKQNSERGKQTLKQIRLWSTTSFKSKFDLLKVCWRVFLNSDWAEWPLTINLRTAWLHFAYLRLRLPWVPTGQLADNYQE